MPSRPLLSLVHLQQDQQNFGAFLHGTLLHGCSNDDDKDDDGDVTMMVTRRQAKINRGSAVSLLRQQQGLLENIWSFMKTDPNDDRYHYKVTIRSCLGGSGPMTEHVWCERLYLPRNPAMVMGSLNTKLLFSRYLIEHGYMMQDEWVEEGDQPVDWDNISDQEFRRHFHAYIKQGTACFCMKCGLLPGDTIYSCRDTVRPSCTHSLYPNAHRGVPATENELAERGFRGHHQYSVVAPQRLPG